MTKDLFLVLSFLLLVAGSALAQQDVISPADIFVENQLDKAAMKGTLRALWNRGIDPMTADMLMNPSVGTAWGISEEQRNQIMERMSKIEEDINETYSGEINEISEGISEKIDTAPDNQWENDEEFVKMVRGLAEKQEGICSSGTSDICDVLDEVLTSEQKQKIMESQLANMAELPYLTPGMFEALNLTDDQKKEMEKIKNELEPEFETILENFVDIGMVLGTKMVEESLKEPQRTVETSDIRKKLLKDDPEFKKIHDEMQSKTKVFTTKFRTKMFDVLTDEQWTRLQKLIDDPPEHAKVFLKKLKEERGEDEKAEKAEGSLWLPGHDSWKPGDPIPEEYRQQRNTRRNFPRRAE